MIDIIGIGHLNLDLTLTHEEILSLPPDKVTQLKKRFARGTSHIIRPQELDELISFVGKENFLASMGGSSFNMIHAVAAIHSALTIGYIGASCNTGYRDLNFADFMRKENIDTQFMPLDRCCPSGVCVSINYNGGRSFACHSGCNNHLAAYLKAHYHDILQYLAGARLIHLSTFEDHTTIETLLALLRDVKKINSFVKISFDPGYPMIKDMTTPTAEIIQLSDYVFVNQIEFDLLSGMASDGVAEIQKAENIFEQYAISNALLILKKTDEIRLFCRENKKVKEQVFTFKIVDEEHIKDSTGAGDTFAAGFLSIILLGGSLNKAVDLGIKFVKTKLINQQEELYSRLKEVFEQS